MLCIKRTYRTHQAFQIKIIIPMKLWFQFIFQKKKETNRTSKKSCCRTHTVNSKIQNSISVKRAHAVFVQLLNVHVRLSQYLSELICIKRVRLVILNVSSASVIEVCLNLSYLLLCGILEREVKDRPRPATLIFTSDSRELWFVSGSFGSTWIIWSSAGFWSLSPSLPLSAQREA